MNFDEIIKSRRSIREFSNKKVKKDDVYALIESARLAPSAANRQPWYFVILEQEEKEKIANIMNDNINDVEIHSTEQTYTPHKSVKGSVRVIKEAPILILVFREKNDEWKDGDYLSIGCSVEHICLKATDLGLGSLWIRDVIFKKSDIEESLGLNNFELVAGVAIGYSTEYSYERHKKTIDQIMEWR